MSDAQPPSLATIAREWARMGCIGFGGPPTHIALLRELCVDERRWLSAEEFEDAVAACNLLPGPASTQLAIFCAWRLGGLVGAILGGLAFIVPGLILILALAALFLGGSPPLVVRGAAAGAGAGVAAVAVAAGLSLVASSRARARSQLRWFAYAALGAVAAATIGPWLVLVLLACGLVETALAGGFNGLAVLFPLTVAPAGIGPLAWLALKVGALSYGGGFVIVPLMQREAVHDGWMTARQFLDAVALGQVTPGPVVLTIAAVGYAAHGIGGGLLATAVAFSPSFLFVLVGGRHFGALRESPRAQAFLAGAGPAAIGAILGAAIPLARALGPWWQYVGLALAFGTLFVLRRGQVATLLGLAALGALLAAAHAVSV